MNLNYITRGNSTPKGKSRVYFTGHPSDYGLYFQPIVQELLQQQNCVVYFDQNPKADYDVADLSFSLEQMQLFVIPITIDFLTRPNRARDVEFPFSQHAHIPVLPLAQENGLEELFNTVCGNLQLLNKNNLNTTGISYEEKMARFLKSILVGDELAKKIRENFSAYFFLSYRQKDRKHAQDLMKLIHKNSLCWDVAIWYDEFLVPGRNFDQLIQEAIEKSKVFVMAVTPNVVEDGNYVMTTEYPLACNAGKPILPLEIISTNSCTLKEKFYNIPLCVNAYDKIALSRVLAEIMNYPIARKCTDDLEHIFYIGLAYLYGIDVEINRKYAFSCIVNAADNGFDEALQKLVQMYQTGDGVECNYYEAIRWQKKLVGIRRKQYIESETDINRFNMINSLFALGVSFYEIRDFPSAKNVYAEVIQLCGERVSISYNMLLACCFDRLGDISRDEYNLVQAREYYHRAMELSEQLVESTPLVPTQLYLACAYLKVGIAVQDQGDYALASEYYTNTLKINEHLVEEFQNKEAQRNLAIVYEYLGDLSMKGELEHAKSCYSRSLALRKELLEEMQTVDAKRNLTVAYEKMGDYSWAKDDLDQAIEYYLQSYELREELVAQRHTIQARNDLSIISLRLSGINQKKNNLDQAKKYALKSLNQQLQIRQECQMIEYKDRLASSYISLGDIYSKAGDSSHAKECYLQALTVCQQLVEESATKIFRNQLVYCYRQLGFVYLKENEGLAKEYFLHAYRISQQLVKESQDERFGLEYIYICDTLSDISQRENNMNMRNEYLIQSMKLSRQLAEENPTVNAQMDLAIRYKELGDIYVEEKLLSQAKEYYSQSAELFQYLILQKEAYEELTKEAKRKLVCIYKIMGDIAKCEGKLKLAEKYYGQSKKMYAEEANVSTVYLECGSHNIKIVL